ncbi:UvrD-helicase domain-containing protein [Shimazuella alba]|uniref:DNA 3'-5' helicase n=1 Tax=Shimazuella alba TaxID=2690964 RepID=A0A6I4VUV4_9BACL|nr:UvrD-helicase domain-containing protein [Shimazuella alba]MXQ54773.1 UvrD-helicase domain-containing protein [Shimazuella alba]
MQKPSYSVLLYCFDFTTEIKRQIENWIKDGIKVYLFTADVLDDIEANKDWVAWRKAYFLQWFAVPYRTEYVDRTHFFFDGHIDEEDLYRYLVSEAEDQGFYSFNPEQYQVEHANSGDHLFVMAGAGTGKTTVMVQRMLFLKHTLADFSFDSVAMITFTNEAATLMRIRLQKRLREYYQLTNKRVYLHWLREMTDIQISTFHSFAKKLLEREGRELHFPSHIQIRNYIEMRKRLIGKWIDRFATQEEEIFKSFEAIPHYLLIRSIVTVIQELENNSLHDSMFSVADFGVDEKHFHQLLQYVVVHSMQELAAYKQERGEWEVNDLIRNLYEMQSADLPLKKQYHTIFVDEFQDTDYMQVQFLQWLEQTNHCRLFIVGDIKQSIYRFRGADYTAFEQLKISLSPKRIRELYLTKNYRSTSKLLGDMEPYFEFWGERVSAFPYSKKDALTPMTDEDTIGVQYLNDLNLRQNLRKLEGKDAAILVRSNRDVEWMVDQCEEWGIACIGQTRGQFFRSRPVREFYQLVRFLLFPRSASTCYALQHSSYGAQTILPTELMEQFSEEKDAFWRSWEKQPDYAYWQSCLQLMRRMPIIPLLEKIVTERNPARCFANRYWQRFVDDQAQDETKFHAWCEQRMYRYQSRLEQLLLLLKGKFSDSIATLFRLEKYLRICMTTDVTENDLPVPEIQQSDMGAIQCMTVHKAKGQEFDHVVIPMMDGLFYVHARPHVFLNTTETIPKIAYKLQLDTMRISNNHFQTYQKEEQEELRAEETRLLYVAMTRARKSLLLANPLRCLNDKPDKWGQLIGWRGLSHVSSSNLSKS